MGLRLEPQAPEPEPEPEPTPVEAPKNPFEQFMSMFTPTTSRTAAPAAVRAKDPASTWGIGASKPTPHPKAGPWPKAPKRELWVPPAGWEPPSRPVPTVASWYDSGERLA